MVPATAMAAATSPAAIQKARWYPPVSAAAVPSPRAASALVRPAETVASTATVSAGRTSALAARGEGTAAALTGGYHLAFWIAAGLVTAAIAVAGAMLRPGD